MFCRLLDGCRFQVWAVCCLITFSARADDLRISSFDRTNIAWNNVFTNAITTIEGASGVAGPWTPLKSFYDKGASDNVILPGTSFSLFRLLQTDISATSQGYTNLLDNYGIITTIAGNGAFGIDNVNYWESAFEGGLATQASLSRPHIAMADHLGNVMIADKNSHAILKVTPDGRIHTVAGTHTIGFNGDGPALGTSLLLNQPNGLDVHADGSFDILDTGNSKVRRVDTNGVMTTLFTDPGGIITGRGLSVKKDGTQAYFCSGTELKKWTPATGVTVVNNKFNDLGNLDIDSTGHVFVTDRGADRVYRISNSGNRSVVAGNGTKTGGGDGFAALDTGLSGVRGIAFLSTDAYFLATHEGSQVWYVDPSGTIRLFLDGQLGGHAGDGGWFHTPGPKVDQPRQITVTNDGDLLITESDNGYIRKIKFGRTTP